MNLSAVAVVYRKELTEWLRDRRTLISTILVPLFAFPFLISGILTLASVMVGNAEKEVPKIMIIGGEDSPQLLDRLHHLDKLEIVPYATNWKSQITEKQIRAAVEIPKSFQAALTEGQSEPTLDIYYYEGELKSSIGADHVRDAIQDYREEVVKQRLASKDLPASVLKPFEVKKENVAPPEKVGGASVGGFIGYAVILLCLTGAMYPAIDLTAGEKERGTIETVLCSPISRLDLVLGKFLLVFSASLVSAILSVTSMGISFAVLGNSHMMQNSGKEALNLNVGWLSVVAVFFMALPLAVLFSAVLMTIALFAKTYKEAQSYLTPLTFLVVIPAIASIMPGVELTDKLALVPVLNTSLVCKEIITGTYHWNSIILIFASTCVYAGAAIFLAVKMFQREDVLFRS
jgi:sodium transport system permease protein